MRNFIRKWKNAKRARLINLIFLVSILIYGLSFSILFSFAMNSVFGIIKSVKIPDGYYISDLDPSDPKFEVSFSIENPGLAEITDLSIDISESILYFENNNSEVLKVEVFEKQIFIGTIIPGRTYSDTFYGNYSDFSIENLMSFVNNANLSYGYQEFLNVDIRGGYFFRLIPFRIFIDSLCLTCGSYVK